MRTLRTKRLYFLGDFRNIEFEDEFELPDDISGNHDIVGKVRELQILQIEKAFREYQKLQATKMIPLANDYDAMINMLTDMQEETYSELLELYNNGDTEKENKSKETEV